MAVVASGSSITKARMGKFKEYKHDTKKNT